MSALEFHYDSYMSSASHVFGGAGSFCRRASTINGSDQRKKIQSPARKQGSKERKNPASQRAEPGYDLPHYANRIMNEKQKDGRDLQSKQRNGLDMIQPQPSQSGTVDGMLRTR